ncbi:hypothetical protein L0Y65_04765 [Candidatus Micrarchaeota archaeon]|nr:hypothetical protein [Candidatus Micrarchaeota archaeon]
MGPGKISAAMLAKMIDEALETSAPSVPEPQDSGRVIMGQPSAPPAFSAHRQAGACMSPADAPKVILPPPPPPGHMPAPPRALQQDFTMQQQPIRQQPPASSTAIPIQRRHTGMPWTPPHPMQRNPYALVSEPARIQGAPGNQFRPNMQAQQRNPYYPRSGPEWMQNQANGIPRAPLPPVMQRKPANPDKNEQ